MPPLKLARVARVIASLVAVLMSPAFLTALDVSSSSQPTTSLIPVPQSSSVQNTVDASRHWAFRPLANPIPPTAQTPVPTHSPIDRFILSRLERHHLSLAPEADPRTLVRRLYFDLIGLPPSPQQAAAFVQSHTRNPQLAIASLIEELLASPHYGERWARHWLDVVRYADSDGQEGDADRPTAHHFRDFVIRAFNQDMPFDAFLRWQLSGDELEPNNPEAIAATGFIVAGPHAELPANLMEEERTRTRFNELDDMLSTTGSAMLGLTLACVRCHDHKYDPIPRQDYYRMLKAFNGGDRALVPSRPLDKARRYRDDMARWKTEFDSAKKARESLPKDADTATKAQLDEALKVLQSRKPQALPEALAFADFGPSPRETYLLARGDFRAQVAPVELGFLSALTQTKSPADYWRKANANARRPDSTQQRRAMAEWLTDTRDGAGALAARVIVNRLWQHHFGEGLVRTVNDFGTRCDPPSHPELLEWLAARLVSGGWRLKPIQRLILKSAVYLQSSAFDPAKAKSDPENRLLARQRPRRIESEILRDSMLVASGMLNPHMYGPAFKAPIAPEAIQARNLKSAYPKDLVDAPANRRRSVYMFHKRVVQQPLMQAFDGPDAQTSCGRRETTTVAPQALALLNDPFVRLRAEDFARRLVLQAGTEVERQVRLAWNLALARDPKPEELNQACTFVQQQFTRRSSRDSSAPNTDATRHQALADFCQGLFALNEFIYVD